MARATGKDGFLYKIKYGEPVVGGASVKVTASGFYKIKSIAAVSSGLPVKNPADTEAVTVSVGNMVYLYKDTDLAEGDAVIPVQLTKISFVTDLTDSSQGTSHDVTTQIDVPTGVRAYAPGAFKDRSGSINGLVETNSDEQLELLKEYRQITVVSDTGISVFESKTGIHEYMLSRYETQTAGETALWEYFPIITEQLQMDKPMDGVQSFNFNYRVDGSSKPGVIYYTVEGTI